MTPEAVSTIYTACCCGLLELCGNTCISPFGRFVGFVLEEDLKCIREHLCPLLFLGVLGVKDRLDHLSEFDLDKERVQVRGSLI